MTSLKKQLSPVVFILALLGINAVLWITYMRSVYLASDTILTAVMGSSLLIGFSLVFFLATRNKIVVRIFGGLENLYIWHRSLAIVTTAFIFVHGYFSTARGVINPPDVFLLGQAMNAGETARNIFIALILIALFAKFMKYEYFRYIHRLLIIPYIYALYHGFFTSIVDLFSFKLLSIWMISISLIGLASSIYMILIYQRTSFKFKGEIIDKKDLNVNIYELKLKLDSTYVFKTGQFAFMKIYKKGISKEPHPFSISGFDGTYIYFTIKSLGDYTDFLKNRLETPAKVRITRPFGDMTFDTRSEKQLWVAGGIGVTPFLGYLRTKEKIEKNIELIYAVQTADEAVHLDQLESLAKQNKNFKFRLFDASEKGFISTNDFEIDDDTTLYMCGPRPMVLALKKQMKKNFPHTPIIYEAFSFTGTLIEDIIRISKLVLVKFKKR